MLYRLSYVSVPVDLAPRPYRPNGVLLRKTHREPTIFFVYYLLPTYLYLPFFLYLLPLPFTYYLSTTYLRLSPPISAYLSVSFSLLPHLPRPSSVAHEPPRQRKLGCVQAPPEHTWSG